MYISSLQCFWDFKNKSSLQVAVRLIVRCNSVVSLYTVFMDSKFTVQLMMHNVIPDPS